MMERAAMSFRRGLAPETKTGFWSLLLTKNLWANNMCLSRRLLSVQKSGKVIDFTDCYAIVRTFSACTSASKVQPLAALRTKLSFSG
jgi:hypothetical protein